MVDFFEALPNEMIDNITDYSDLNNLKKIKLVSKFWTEHSEDKVQRRVNKMCRLLNNLTANYQELVNFVHKVEAELLMTTKSTEGTYYLLEKLDNTTLNNLIHDNFYVAEYLLTHKHHCKRLTLMKYKYAAYLFEKALNEANELNDQERRVIKTYDLLERLAEQPGLTGKIAALKVCNASFVP